MYHRWQPISHDLERLLELDHELPVVLLEVVAEVVLAGVDGGAVDLAHQEVLKTKESPVQVSCSVARWQNLIPSFPWIAPGWRAWGCNP